MKKKAKANVLIVAKFLVYSYKGTMVGVLCKTDFWAYVLYPANNATWFRKLQGSTELFAKFATMVRNFAYFAGNCSLKTILCHTKINRQRFLRQ